MSHSPPILGPSRRGFLRAFVLGGTAGLLGGCGLEREGDGPGVTLDLWTWALRPRFDDYMARLVADFEASHPGVRVRWADVAFDAMRRKAFAAGAAGTMPDVINFSDQHFAQFAGLGALAPLAGLLPGDPAERYVAGALAANVIDGEMVGLPWYLSTAVRVMNTPLLAEGGLTPGTVGGDWETLLGQAADFKARTGAFLFTLPLGDRSDVPPMMLAEGLDILRPREGGGYEADLTGDATLAYVRRWAEAYRRGLLPRASATAAYEGNVADFTAGRVAVLNANALARVKAEAPTLYDQVAVGPAVVGKLGAPHVAVTHVAVPRQSRHPKLAAELAWHVTSPRWQTELAVMASRVPSTAESLDDPSFAAEGEDPQEIATALGVEQLPRARAFTPPTGVWPDLRRVFDEGMKRVLLSDADVAGEMAGVEAEWNRILRADAAGMPYK